ncbi:MAG TPA: hypothetical protein V6C76_13170 [Drouetiella sp.]
MPRDVDSPEPPAQEPHEASGPSSIGQAWVHSINPIDLYKDARESANSWLPMGLGFAIQHPSELASPEVAEMLVLDPLFRTARAVGDLGSATIDSVQDGGNSMKRTIDAVKDVAFFGIDVATLNFSEAGQDVVNFGSDVYHAVKSGIDSTIYDPIVGIGKAIGEFL